MGWFTDYATISRRLDLSLSSFIIAVDKFPAQNETISDEPTFATNRYLNWLRVSSCWRHPRTRPTKSMEWMNKERNDLCSAMLISMINNLFYYTLFLCHSLSLFCFFCFFHEGFSTEKAQRGKGKRKKMYNDGASFLMGFSAVSNSRLSKVVYLLTIPDASSIFITANWQIFGRR